MPSQKPKPKNANLHKKNAARPITVKKQTQDMAQQVEQFLENLQLRLQGWMQNWEKSKDIIKNNYELGHRHLQLGNVNDAIMRFRFVTWLDPKRVDAYYYLGCSYLAKNEKGKARAAFEKTLKLRPVHEEALYMLAILSTQPLTQAQMPKAMPPSLAQEYFDGIAAGYNQDQLQMQKYDGHTILCSAVRSHVQPGRIDHAVLELGTGTGLCGPLIRDIASPLTGVDISPAMLKEAARLQDDEGQAIYDTLINRDARQFLADMPDANYDILLAATTPSYIGDLYPLFQQTARTLRRGGIFALTCDALEGEGYRFDPASARFRFSQSYLMQAASACGIRVLELRQVHVYPKSLDWLCVLTR